MKNTTKISFISGLMFAGMALGGIHIANAQTSVDSGYTVVIPSEISIDKDTGKSTFSISGKVNAQTELDVTTTSQNGYKLKCGSQFVDYTLDKQSFHVDNKTVADQKSFNQSFNATMNRTDMNFSGNYKDKLTFNIVSNVYTYSISYNLNGGSISGQKTSYNVTTDSFTLPTPTRTGYTFTGWTGSNGNTPQKSVTIAKGSTGNKSYTANWELNTYTLTFDANGGTVSETSRTVTEGNQIRNLPTPTKEGYQFYGWYNLNGGSDWQGSCLILSDSTLQQDMKIIASWGPSVETLAKQNKSALPDGTYKIFSTISSFSDYCLKPYSENSGDGNQIILKKEDASEYDIWQVEHDSNGFVMLKNKKTEKYLDLSSAFATSKRKIQLYSGNGTYAQKWIVVNKNGKYQIISAVNPNFVVDLSNASLDGGDYGIIQLYYDNTTAAQRWNFKKIYDIGTVLNIEGTEYTVIEQKENNKYLVMTNESIGNLRILQSGSRPDSQNVNTYEGSSIDEDLENDWYNSLPSSLKVAIQPINIKQASYATKDDSDSKQETGPNGQTYNEINRHVFLPSVDEIGKVVDLKNPDKVKSFLNGMSIWTRDSFQGIAFYMEYLDAYSGSLDYNSVGYFYGVRPAFVIDLSKVDYTVTGTVNYK